MFLSFFKEIATRYQRRAAPQWIYLRPLIYERWKFNPWWTFWQRHHKINMCHLAFSTSFKVEYLFAYKSDSSPSQWPYMALTHRKVGNKPWSGGDICSRCYITMALKAPDFSSLKNALKKSQNLKKVLKKVLREKTSLIGYLKKLTSFLYLASAAHRVRIISKANFRMGIGL